MVRDEVPGHGCVQGVVSPPEHRCPPFFAVIFTLRRLIPWPILEDRPSPLHPKFWHSLQSSHWQST